MNRIREGWLRSQQEEGAKLAADSDLLELVPVASDGGVPTHYVARFHCDGLVRGDDGQIRKANLFEVGISFPRDYLRRAHPAEVLAWVGPRNIYHPNILAPLICVGRLSPGTGLVEILFQVADIITFRKVTMREDDALNKDACCWARHNQHLFPIDSRPLKRRVLQIAIRTNRCAAAEVRS
jgi:hypothetical protein